MPRGVRIIKGSPKVKKTELKKVEAIIDDLVVKGKIKLLPSKKKQKPLKK